MYAYDFQWKWEGEWESGLIEKEEKHPEKSKRNGKIDIIKCYNMNKNKDEYRDRDKMR